jgi:hypothetical protein
MNSEEEQTEKNESSSVVHVHVFYLTENSRRYDAGCPLSVDGHKIRLSGFRFYESVKIKHISIDLCFCFTIDRRDLWHRASTA